MSCVSRISPSPAMNAMESGIFVSFIQTPVLVSPPKTNSIPRSSAIASRNIRPRPRSAAVRASSTVSSLRLPAPSMSVIVAVARLPSPSSPPPLLSPPPQATASASRSDRASGSAGRKTPLRRGAPNGRQPRQPAPLGRLSEHVHGQPQRPDHPQEVQVGQIAAEQVAEEAPELLAALHHRHVRRRREVEQLLQLARHAQLRLKPPLDCPLVGGEVVRLPGQHPQRRLRGQAAAHERHVYPFAGYGVDQPGGSAPPPPPPPAPAAPPPPPRRGGRA